MFREIVRRRIRRDFRHGLQDFFPAEDRFDHHLIQFSHVSIRAPPAQAGAVPS